MKTWEVQSVETWERISSLKREWSLILVRWVYFGSICLPQFTCCSINTFLTPHCPSFSLRLKGFLPAIYFLPTEIDESLLYFSLLFFPYFCLVFFFFNIWWKWHLWSIKSSMDQILLQQALYPMPHQITKISFDSIGSLIWIQ